MALVKCPDCGKDVSDIAPSCPGCGRPMGATDSPAAQKTGSAGTGAKRRWMCESCGHMAEFKGGTCSYCGYVSKAAGRKEARSTHAPAYEYPIYPVAEMGPRGTKQMPDIKCQQCGGRMAKTTASSGFCLGQLVSLIVFLIGLFITVFFFLTIIGPIIGALMMAAALFVGGTKRKVWKCEHCGCIFERA